MIRRHDRHGIDAAGIDEPQPELGFRPALAGSREVGREIALEALLRKRPAVTEQAQTHLAVDNDRAATHRIALDASERVRHPILSARDARHATDRDDRGRENPHPNTSPVMVRNHASASAASTARAACGASDGLTPPEPGTSASCPLVGT